MTMTEWYQLIVQIVGGFALALFFWRVWPAIRPGTLAVMLFAFFMFSTGANLIATSIARGEPRHEIDEVAVLRVVFIASATLGAWVLQKWRS